MPRTARRKSKTNVYHIVLRGINRQVIFEDQEDAFMFLSILRRFRDKCGYEVYGYCLMENHIHILLKEGEEVLGNIMRRIGASFVYWYNIKYERTGHLFQDRYKSEPVEDVAYLLNVLRYIHHNPIKAGIVTSALDYKWSSYQEYLGKSKIIDKDFILGLFHKNEKEALSYFKGFHKEQCEEAYLDITVPKRIADREAIEIIKEICKVQHCVDLQKLTKDEGRDTYLKTIKNHGLSTRQIARLTGISRGVIMRA